MYDFTQGSDLLFTTRLRLKKRLHGSSRNTKVKVIKTPSIPRDIILVTKYASLMKGRDVFVTLKLQTKDVWYISTKELSKYLKCYVCGTCHEG